MGQQLQELVDSFGAAYWSGSGFGAAAELEIGVRMRQIVNDLNQGAAGSIEKLLINPAAKGIIGSIEEGPLIVDCASSTDALVRNAGEVDLRIEAAAASHVEILTTANTRARTRCLDGLFKIVSMTAGRLTMSQASTLNNYYGLGGKAEIGYNSTAIGGVFKLTGGEHTLRRRADAIQVGAGATLIIDHDPAITSWTGDTIEMLGGTVIVKSGVIPSITGIGGILDFSQARGSIGSGLGSVKFEVEGTEVIPNPDVDLSNMVSVSGVYRNDSGPIKISRSGISQL